MTEKDIRKLKNTAFETLDDMENINVDKLTKDQFLLIGSAYGILQADIGNEDAQNSVIDVERENMLPEEETPPESKITLLQRELKEALDSYGISKENYMKHQTADYGKIMIEHLHYLLEVFKSMFKILWQSSNTDAEKQAIKEFFAEYLEKYFNKF
ncbi:MAG: hypothetical protein FWF92_07615 [Oscillospiraceae bacterium]|nr:hypothetical protein [Oscillospiraceae bacterium]